MSDFLEGWVKEKKVSLDSWSKNFWEIPLDKTKAIFAQRGYEDKGYGHIKGIISNAGELLEKYCSVLCPLNHHEKKGKKYESESLFNHLEPSLILFYVAAHLHDIGMNFPGIFKALSEVVAAGGDNALHIGEILHNYHHYASFIILLEINCLDSQGKLQGKCPYLSNIDDKDFNDPGKKASKLIGLKTELMAIYEKHFKDYFSSDKGSNKNQGKNEGFEEFLVVLAILCLLHRAVNFDYVQSILRKYEADQHKKETIHYFHKWWDFLERARQWTGKLQERLPYKKDPDNRFPGDKQVILTKRKETESGNNTSETGPILDLLLVEALLQYGDKTEITIARLTRADENKKTRLKLFNEDTQYDNQEDSICKDMARGIISSFARFRACRFIPLIFVEVQEMKDNKEKLEVVFHYCRFENDEDIFRVIRYHNEKDFFDLGFLEVMKIHIPLLLKNCKEYKENPILDIQFKKEEHQIEELNNDDKIGVKELKECLESESKNRINPSDRFPYTPQNRKAILTHSKLILDPEEKKKTESAKRAFCKTCDLIVPSSFEIMAVLNLFREEE